jgi:hypothetical protein
MSTGKKEGQQLRVIVSIGKMIIMRCGMVHIQIIHSVNKHSC